MTLKPEDLGRKILTYTDQIAGSIQDRTDATSIKRAGANALGRAISEWLSGTIKGLNVPKADGSPKIIDFSKIEMTSDGKVIASAFLVGNLPPPTTGGPGDNPGPGDGSGGGGGDDPGPGGGGTGTGDDPGTGAGLGSHGGFSIVGSDLNIEGGLEATRPILDIQDLYEVARSANNTITNTITETTNTETTIIISSGSGGGGGVSSHSALTDLSNDDHSIYFLLSGRSGGTYAKGGINSGDTLTLESTSNATKGNLYIQPSGGKASFGEPNPAVQYHFKYGNGISSRPTFNSNVDLLLLEGSGSNHTAFNILSENTKRGAIVFSDNDSREAGSLVFDHSFDGFDFYINSISRLRLSGTSVYPSANTSFSLPVLSSTPTDYGLTRTPFSPETDGQLYWINQTGIKYNLSSSVSGTTTGHVIQFSGTNQTQRAYLNFEGSGVVVSDSSENNRTTVTIGNKDPRGHDVTALPGIQMRIMASDSDLNTYLATDVYSNHHLMLSAPLSFTGRPWDSSENQCWISGNICSGIVADSAGLVPAMQSGSQYIMFYAKINYYGASQRFHRFIGNPGLETGQNNSLASLSFETDQTFTTGWEFGAGTDVVISDIPAVNGVHHIAMLRENIGSVATLRLLIDGKRVYHNATSSAKQNSGTSATWAWLASVEGTGRAFWCSVNDIVFGATSGTTAFLTDSQVMTQYLRSKGVY